MIRKIGEGRKSLKQITGRLTRWFPRDLSQKSDY